MVLIELDTNSTQQLNINVKDFKDLDQIIEKIAQEFKLDEDSEKVYGLKEKYQGLLLSKIDDISNWLPFLHYSIGYLNAEILIFVNLQTEAQETIEEIDLITQDVTKNHQTSKINRVKVNKIQLNLRSELDVYIEELIRLDGIMKLINLMLLSEELTMVCLKSLTYVLVYLNGVEYLRQKPHLFIKMYELINHQSPEIKKYILSIFISLCKYMEGAYSCINKAAINNAKTNGQSPYATVVQGFQSADLELKLNIMSFLNWMIQKCPSEKKLAKFLARLENLGLYEELRELQKEKSPEIQHQLKVFAKNSKNITPSLTYEIEIHKNRNKELQEHCDTLERKIEHYMEQQSLLMLMREDLEKYKKIAQMSKDLATYYSPFTPLHQYKTEYLIKLPQIKSEIVDLKSVMQETSSNIDHLNKRIKELEKTNLDLNVKNEQTLKKQEELEKAQQDLAKNAQEEKSKLQEEINKLKDKLEKAETNKVMIEKRLQQKEKELKEVQDICSAQKDQIKNLFEAKKEIVYVDKELPGKLKESDLAVFEKKCDTLSQMCDTLDLIIRKDASIMTDLKGEVVTPSAQQAAQQTQIPPSQIAIPQPPSQGVPVNTTSQPPLPPPMGGPPAPPMTIPPQPPQMNIAPPAPPMGGPPAPPIGIMPPPPAPPSGGPTLPLPQGMPQPPRPPMGMPPITGGPPAPPGMPPTPPPMGTPPVPPGPPMGIPPIPPPMGGPPAPPGPPMGMPPIPPPMGGPPAPPGAPRGMPPMPPPMGGPPAPPGAPMGMPPIPPPMGGPPAPPGIRGPPGPPGPPGAPGMMPPPPFGVPPGPPGMGIPPPGMAAPGIPGMGFGARRPAPTKPAIQPSKKLTNFNWRRVLVMPPGSQGKKESVWDEIKEVPLNQAEIEDLFEAKTRQQQQKRKLILIVKYSAILFSIAASYQNMSITLSKAPPPQKLKEALRNLDESLISIDQINGFLRIFPPPDVIEGLIEEVKNTPPDEQWDRNEAYFIQIIDIKGLKQRMVIWQIKYDYDERKDQIASIYNIYELAFKELKNSKYLKQILAFILSIGNILNGGTAKGQADGFYLEALSKTTTMKDMSGKNILQYICDKMKKEDEEFVNIKSEFKNCYVVNQYSIKDEETKLREVKGGYERAKNNFDQVLKLSNGVTDPFCEKIGLFLQGVQQQIGEFEVRLQGIQKSYTECCEYYLIDKNDEKAQNSQEFFKFFTQFIDQVVKNMPKEEKKKAAPANKANAPVHKIGQKIGSITNMK